MRDIRIVISGEVRDENEAFQKVEALKTLLKKYRLEVDLFMVWPEVSPEQRRAEVSRWN